MKFIKFVLLSAIAIGLGIILGTVPIRDGMTASDLLEAWITGDRNSGVQKPRRISQNTSKPSGNAKPEVGNASLKSRQSKGASDEKKTAQSAKSHVTTAPSAPPEPQAPITAEAANSPEQTSASDKAALDKLISKKARQ